jgi:hypothetical protein
MTYNETSLLYLNESYGCLTGTMTDPAPVESPSNLDGIVARYPGGPPARTAVQPRP